MPTVIGVRFKPVTKVYFFLPPQEDDLALDDPIIVETSRGVELGWVAQTAHTISGDEVKGNLKQVLRRANPIDLVKLNEYRNKEADALEVCKQKVAELNLPMKAVAAEYAFDGSRLTFMFCAEQRVDFRALVRALVKVFHTRVEMRQIGARDEAKIIDGYGRCGRQLCCSSWLTEFHPVSIKMAKNQQLPLAPTEISGLCGRLLCCLAYEDEAYKTLRKDLPRIGSAVETPEGEGKIRGLNILRQHVIVALDGGSRVEFAVEDVKLINQRNRNQGSNRKQNQPQNKTAEDNSSVDEDHRSNAHAKTTPNQTDSTPTQHTAPQSEPPKTTTTNEKSQPRKRQRRPRRPRNNT